MEPRTGSSGWELVPMTSIRSVTGVKVCVGGKIDSQGGPRASRYNLNSRPTSEQVAILQHTALTRDTLETPSAQ